MLGFSGFVRYLGNLFRDNTPLDEGFELLLNALDGLSKFGAEHELLNQRTDGPESGMQVDKGGADW